MSLEFVKGNPIFTNINTVTKQYNYLTENTSTDVIIVGGGVTGAILSYYFSKKGIDTVVLEKGRIGHGSTSVTTALLQYELDENANELLATIKEDDVALAYSLGVKALDEIEKFSNDHGNTFDFIKRDTLLYTSKKIEIEDMKQEYEFRKKHGFEVEFVDENNEFDFDVKAGVYSKSGGAEIDPYKFTESLLKASIENNLRVYENTEVLKVDYTENNVTAHTTYGKQVKGKIILVATGYNTQLFTKRDFGVKTTTYNIATTPLDKIEGWKNNVLIRDNDDPYNYLRTTLDNRIIIGGEDVEFGLGVSDEELALKKYSILENRLKSMFKNMKDIQIEYKYCGAFLSTKDNLGFLGKDPKNDKLWYGLGYGANGILFAILGGMMLSDLYLGKTDENLRLFKVDRFDHN